MTCYLSLGIQYLRDFLHLPQEIVPATLKRPVRTETARAKPKGGVQFGAYQILSLWLTCIGFSEGMGGKDDRGDRDAYRKMPSSEYEKKGGAGPDFQPEFVSFYGVECWYQVKFKNFTMNRAGLAIA